MKNEEFCYRAWLIRYVEQRKKKHPAYSFRSLAKVVGMSPSHLSNIISKKRSLTLDSAKQISDKLNLNKEERERLYSSVDSQWQYSKVSGVKYQHIKDEEFLLVDKWYYFAILSLSDLEENKADYKWIASRLNISCEEAASAYETLKALKYIEETADGHFIRSQEPLLSSKRATADEMKAFHSQILDLAKNSLCNESSKENLFSFRVNTISEEHVPIVKMKVKELQNELMSFLQHYAAKAKGKVFAFNMQMFSLDKGEAESFYAEKKEINNGRH